jgi:hypothetical protein
MSISNGQHTFVDRFLGALDTTTVSKYSAQNRMLFHSRTRMDTDDYELPGKV